MMIFSGWNTVKDISCAAVTQQARYTTPMLFYCWPVVCDADPTVKQHRDSVSCLLGISNLKKIYAPEVMLALDWWKSEQNIDPE